MKKKTYIAPEVVTVEMPKLHLMAGSPEGYANTPDNKSNEDASTGLAKGGMFWSDDEEYYEE